MAEGAVTDATGFAAAAGATGNCFLSNNPAGSAMVLAPDVAPELAAVVPVGAVDRGGAVGAPVQACKASSAKNDKAGTNIVGTLMQLFIFTTKCENDC